MQAMNGESVSVARRHLRLIGLLIALFAISAAAAPQVAGAKTRARSRRAAAGNPIYLALGDSLAFGYSQKQFNENEIYSEKASRFEHGYTNDYLNLVATGKLVAMSLVNDGCPGETSKSLIGNGPELAKLNEELAKAQTTKERKRRKACASGHGRSAVRLPHRRRLPAAQ